MQFVHVAHDRRTRTFVNRSIMIHKLILLSRGTIILRVINNLCARQLVALHSNEIDSVFR